jgi:diacylglycerol kinase family enzyme
MRAGVIINSNSGTAQAMSTGKAESRISRHLREKGWSVESRFFEGGRLRQPTEQLLQNGCDILFVGGGDGTVSAVAEIAVERGVAIAPLPLGTHNHFAKDLCIPQDLDAALAAILEGEFRKIDAGCVNGKLFLNNSSIGAYPQAVEARSKLQQKVPITKWAAMAIATVNTFARRPLAHVRIGMDGREITRSAPFIFVGNNQYDIDLFAIKLRTSLNSGKLCIYTARCTGISCLFRLFFLSLINRLKGSRDFEMFLCETAVITPKQRHAKVSRDGEVMMMETPLKYRIMKGALRVMAPKEPPAQAISK